MNKSNTLFKLILLLTALVTGGESVRADKVVILSEDFTEHYNKTRLEAVGWKIEGNWSMVTFSSGNQGFQIGPDNKKCSATTPAFSAMLGNKATLNFRVRSSVSTGSEVNTLTITGNGCKINGQSSITVDAKVGSGNAELLTITITEASASSKIKFSTAKEEGCVIDDVEISYIPSITLSSLCTNGKRYYGTFSSSVAFVVPNHLTVSEIKVENDFLQVFDYATDDVVPANTGVMVSSNTAGDHSVEVTSGGTSILGDNNMLKPSGSGISSTQMAERMAEGTQFYRLTMHNGSQIGFWWGAEEGAAFDLGANKAYLAVPSTAAARLQGLWFSDESEGITGLSREVTDDKQPVYDLQGRKIVIRKSANGKFQRGLYITNGRKVVR